MLRDSYGSSITILTSVRRKYFRAKAAGGDLTGFSFRLAFLLQVLVVLLLTLAQAPIFYIWAKRSCLFLTKFIYYGVLSAILRMSLMGVALDFAWYLILQTWGWKDLCPLCTERIVHCDCFNDELLVLAVERVGPKWELIRVLDGLMAKQNNFNPQFAPYIADQLQTWDESYESNIQLCITREKKILELNSRIKLDTFEKHYDSNISDVFHALTRSVMKHRRQEKQRSRREEPGLQDERSARSPLTTHQTSDGETMWVFDTPEQRLQRREEEKLQRKRIVRVLND
ncbi:hypothetical protein GN244_ATG02645 [Phytophthora infestans]|uniref:Transmembrane protein n=1 Tax=Phytophthora infestans TaxID=4787 RepID=A0A833TEG4_PHYIN|nr:hypothetical protein GN244_ATG02645 [Phytophthora infestans]